MAYAEQASQLAKSKEQRKFNGMFDTMEESNIWEALTKLRLLQVVLKNEWYHTTQTIKYLYKKCRHGKIIRNVEQLPSSQISELK